MSWKSISLADYNLATSGSESLLTELIPDIGKVRSQRSIECRMFEGINEPLSKRFLKHWGIHDPGMIDPDKYKRRLFVQHTTGVVFCLGTLFLTRWRIWGDRKDIALIPNFCAFAGIPASAYERSEYYIMFTRTNQTDNAGSTADQPPIKTYGLGDVCPF
jgi:hypothetical protein